MDLKNYFYLTLCILYILSLVFILLYSIGAFTLTRFYIRAQKRKSAFSNESGKEKPTSKVLIQLPIYNEKYVVERLIERVCRLDYPRELLQIDVLDDSDDSTSAVISSKVDEYARQGINIQHKKRENRTGYKAGALKHFMDDSDCDFIVVFDADFVPPSNFLSYLLPHFKDNDIGMIQSRWGHLNQEQSLLTKLQALALNFHFTVEHQGRSEGDYFMNFNGTAGIWRKECIQDAGGWSDKTLTEDLELSYRAQLKGWKFKYVSEIVSDAELPATMQALKVQQYRWNKGGAQCFKQLLKPVIRSKSMTFYQKLFALMHLFGSTIYVFIFTVFVLCFVMVLLRPDSQLIDATLTFSSVFVISTLLLCYSYWVSWKESEGHSKKRFLRNFFLYLAFTSGLSFYNLTAVLSGYFSKNSEFKRTPKFNIKEVSQAKHTTYFNPKISYHLIIEIFLALLFLSGMLNSLYYLDIATFLFFSLITMGFGCVSFYQIKELRI